MNSPIKIGFIGCGQMATALARGMLDAGVTDRDSLAVSGRSAEGRDAFAAATGSRPPTQDNRETLFASDVVVLAVKPHAVADVLDELDGLWTTSKLVVSVAAGVSLRAMEDRLPDGQPVIRVMPNTPCLVRQGVSAYSLGTAATGEHADLVERLLGPVGIVERIDETLMDAVIGVSGSGPAYVYQMIEALSDGGVRQGLSRAMATRLAAQTLRGAATMVLETGDHPGSLKDAVTSPGGTTIAAIHALERGGLRATLMNAVEAAAKRSRQMDRANRRGRRRRSRDDQDARDGR